MDRYTDFVWGSMASTDEDEDSSNSADDKVRTDNNHIYFYSEVTRPRCLVLNKAIKNLTTRLHNQGTTLENNPANLYLHINSYGGSVFAGLSSVDYILTAKVPVVTIIDGCAASAATLMSVVGTKRLMHRHSFMLIHQLSSGMWGKFEDLKDDIANCELFMDTIKRIYEEHTTIPKKQLNEILKRDIWWDAKTCLKYGLVDEII